MKIKRIDRSIHNPNISIDIIGKILINDKVDIPQNQILIGIDSSKEEKCIFINNEHSFRYLQETSISLSDLLKEEGHPIGYYRRMILTEKNGSIYYSIRYVIDSENISGKIEEHLFMDKIQFQLFKHIVEKNIKGELCHLPEIQ